MKLKFDQKKGNRLKRYFFGIQNFDGYWYNKKTNRWEYNISDFEEGITNTQTCKTVKEFKRKLKYAPKGVKFVLISTYVGHDVYGVGQNNSN